MLLNINIYLLHRSNNIKGDVISDNSFQNINIDNVEGNLQLVIRHSEVYISEIKGDVDLEISFKKAKLEEIQGDLSIRSSHVDLQVKNISGKISGNSNFGKLAVNNLRNSIDLRSEHTDIDIVVPDGLDNYVVNCRLEYGSFKNDFALTVNEYNNVIRIEKINERGDKNIKLDTRFSDVLIKRK